MKKITIRVILIVFAVLVIIFGVQFFTKTGIFKVPGVITYDESLLEEEKSFIANLFPEEIVLENDVNISAQTISIAQTPENSLLYDILVPVTNFYDERSTVSPEEAKELLSSINTLDSTKKLLAIDDNYFLDTFNSGAFFRILKFEGENPSETMDIIRPALSTFPTKENTLSLAQTGVTALSRGMYSKLQSTGDATYFAKNIKDFLAEKDLTHISNEASFTNSANSSNICSDWRMLDAITAIGTDIVELTGNHNQDCGDDSAIATIDKYNELGMKIVGGGKTASEAATALQLSEKNTHITMLGYNYSTGGYTTDNTPGANYYTEEKITADIKEAKERGDFIIVDIQYFECSEYDTKVENTTCDSANSASGQQQFFRNIIDMGADMVIGTSAHQPQTYELYNGKPIYYGLGNLFFDQFWWPGTTRSLIITSYFVNGKQVQARLTPTVYDTSMQTKLMDEETSRWFIKRLNMAQ